jgi:predicted nucleic acid-binding protein
MSSELVFPDQCVVDASALIKLVLVEQGSEQARALLRTRSLDARATPDLAYLECANILALRVARRLLPIDEARAGYVDLLALPTTVHPALPLVSTALQLSLAHNISVYDAVYVALAGTLGIPLLTADAVLVGKMSGAKIQVMDLARF